MRPDEAWHCPVQVYYASTCYAPTSEMKKGIIKYVYDTGISSATMQLFVTSSGDLKSHVRHTFYTESAFGRMVRCNIAASASAAI